MKPKGVVVIGPAWYSCGSYEVFKRQMQCMRDFGFRTYFLAVSPIIQIGNTNPYWGYYYSMTGDLGADHRGHTARSRAFFKHAGFWKALPGLLSSSIARVRLMNAQMMSIPQSLKAFVADHEIETVICHHYFNLPLAQRVRKLLGGSQLILETQDVQSRHYQNDKHRHPITKRTSTFDENIRDEMEISGEADTLIHYNEEETATFRSYIPQRRHLTVFPAFPRNYDLLARTPDPTPADVFDFLIVASANDPNYRSIVWFLENVWSPELDAKYDLRIVGNVDTLFETNDSPLRHVYKKRLLGRVESLFDLYKNARYVLLPVSEGQGISIKTIECLSFGKTIVSTPLAFRGFVERVPIELRGEAAGSAAEMRSKIMASDVTGPPRIDPRVTALYESLFSVEAQTECYRSLMARARTSSQSRKDRAQPPCASQYEGSTGIMSSTQSDDFVAQTLCYIADLNIDKARELPETPLRYLEYYLKVYFAGHGNLSTLETGSGASTILFARYASRHVSHECGADIEQRKALLQAAPFERRAEASFVKKPVWTVPASAEPDLDLVLLNGPTAYPVPEVHLFALLRRLKPGGILFIADIDVPSIGAMFRFLERDEMFFSHGIALQTGILVRTPAPIFNFEQSPWHLQAANVQSYVGPGWQRYSVALPCPLHIEFDGRLNQLPAQFNRGFVLNGGRPATDGGYSLFRLVFQDDLAGEFRLKLELEAVAVSARAQAGCSISVNDGPPVEIRFGQTTYHEVEVAVQAQGQRQFDVVLLNHDVHSAGTLQHRAVRFAKRLIGLPRHLSQHVGGFELTPSVIIKALSFSRAAPDQNGASDPTVQDKPMRRADGSIVSFGCRGASVAFFVQDPHDSIQAHHNVGQFYEREELELLTAKIPAGARILDVGANIGNHTIWFEKFIRAKRIVPIEPQEQLINLLKTNCTLNGLTTVDYSYLGVALGDANETGEVQIEQLFNPAGASIAPSADGVIMIRNGDELLDGQDFDFIKIDVEGAEIKVIRGLKKLLARARPILFVEVWEENRAEFDELMAEFEYELDESFRRYSIATNLLMRPVAADD